MRGKLVLIKIPVNLFLLNMQSLDNWEEGQVHEGCISNIFETIWLKKMFSTLLTQLRKQICNKKEKKVCCRREQKDKPTNNLSKGPNNSSSPSYLPDPWMVLLRRERPNKRIWWHCGGTLINQWFVITAAHCGPTIDNVRKYL